MKVAFVTGATGFVGNELVKELVKHGVKVYALVRDKKLLYAQENRKRVLEHHNVVLIQGQIENIAEVYSQVQDVDFDTYYNFAWSGLRGNELCDYAIQIRNVQYNMDAYRLAEKMGCKRFVGAGSIAQYEIISEQQLDGFDKHVTYKVAKYFTQILGKELSKNSNVAFIWPIITNIYGAGENSPRLINTLIKSMLGDKDFALSAGTQYYDFVYVTDAAKAFYLIGEYGKPNKSYVIGSGKPKPLKNFLINIPDILQSKGLLDFGKMEFKGYSLPVELYSTELLQEDTGYVATISFEDGIKKTADWIRKQDTSNRKGMD